MVKIKETIKRQLKKLNIFLKSYRENENLCRCKVCKKDFEYDGLYSPMLTEEKWFEVVSYYKLRKYEIRAERRLSRTYYTRLDKHKEHLFICLDCMEKALGRKLTKDDVNDSIFNKEFNNLLNK